MRHRRLKFINISLLQLLYYALQRKTIVNAFIKNYYCCMPTAVKLQRQYLRSWIYDKDILRQNGETHPIRGSGHV